MNKIKKLIRFIQSNTPIMADFYYITQVDEYNGSVRLVPEDFNITEIPLFKKYCKMGGFNVDNTFDCDEERSEGYYEYHECILEKESDFIEKIMEEF